MQKYVRWNFLLIASIQIRKNTRTIVLKFMPKHYRHKLQSCGY